MTVQEALVSLQEIEDAGATLAGEFIVLRIKVAFLEKEIKTLKGEQ